MKNSKKQLKPASFNAEGEMPCRENSSQGFSVVLFIGTLCLLALLFSPFFGVAVAAISLGISFFPLHLWLKKKLPFLSPTWRALLSDILVIIFIVLPIGLMAWALVEQSDSWSPFLKAWRESIAEWRQGKIIDSSPGLRDLGSWISQTFAIKPSQFRRQAILTADQLMGRLMSFGTEATAAIPSVLVGMALMIVALFFVFRDGPKLYSYFEDFLPLREQEKRECRERGHLMIDGVIRGWLLGAVIQGFVASFGYLVAGVQGWMFFGFVTILTGLIPLIGTSLVWVPLAMIAFFNGSPGQGMFILAWGVFVVGVIDNVLRPYLVGKNSDVPFVYLFFSFLGGVQVWGLKGIILGPVLVAIAPVFFDIYRNRYLISDKNRSESQIKIREEDHPDAP